MNNSRHQRRHRASLLKEPARYYPQALRATDDFQIALINIRTSARGRASPWLTQAGFGEGPPLTMSRFI